MGSKRGKMSLTAGACPRQRQASPREWTTKKTEEFFAALGASCNVRHAADAAGVSSSSAYRRRQGNAEFRAMWAAAVHEGYIRLELALLERALIGSGEAVIETSAEEAGAATLRALPPAVMLSMLKMHRDVAREGAAGLPGGRDEDGEQRADELRERIAGKLERLRKQLEARA